jgi:hypothetical protein
MGYQTPFCVALLIAVLSVLIAPAPSFSAEKDGFSRLTVAAFKAEKVPSFQDTPIDSLRVLRYRNNNFESIPFQLDRMDLENKYLFPGDPGATRELLKPEDEFVLQGDDLGQRAPGELRRQLTGTVEISVSRGEITRWAYLGVFDVPKNPKDYVDFDTEKNSVVSDCYAISGHPENPSFYNELIIGGQDHIDRVKLRAYATLFFGKLKIERNEEDIRGEGAGVIDGPIRVLRRIKYSVRILAGIHSPTLTRVTHSYRAVNDLPNEMNVPFKLDSVFDDLHSVAYIDFDPAIGGARLFCPTCEDGFTVNGKMEPHEKPEVDLGSRNFSLCSKFGSMTFAVWLYGPTLTVPVGTRGFFQDRMDVPDPPEELEGKYGVFGWGMKDLHKVPKGRYSFHAILLFPEQCPGKGKSKAIADEYLAPYRVDAVRIE